MANRVLILSEMDERIIKFSLDCILENLEELSTAMNELQEINNIRNSMTTLISTLKQ